MRIQWLRGIAVRLGLLGAVALTLVSCGGGGVSSETTVQLGALAISPNTGSLYAGVPVTINLSGGTRPYRVISNEQTILPVNLTVNGGSFTVIPNNPGVIDVGLDPNAVPSRTAILTVTDATGSSISGTYSVLQNFATGYSVGIVSLSTCGATVSATSTNPAACAGFESLITLTPTTDGVLRPSKQLTLTALLGSFGLIDAQGNVVQSVTITTDSFGRGSGRLFAFPTAGTQFAILRVTDVQTGAFRDVNFVLDGAPISLLAVIPTTISLTGPTTLQCGGGSSNVIVTGGLPPYTAVSTQPNSFTVSPALVTFSGGSFTVNVLGGAPPNCPTGSIVVTDASGQTATITITTSAGSTVPPQPLTVSPQFLCLADPPNSSSVLVNGGNTNKVINSGNTALVTAAPTTLNGNGVITLTAVGAGGAGTAVAVTVNDGGTPQTIQVTRKTTCP